MSIMAERPSNEILDCPEGSPYLFDTEAFYKMVDLGVLPFRNRAALWDGIVYDKPVNTIVRAAVGMKLNSAIIPILPPGWFASIDNSLTVAPDKSPTPDMVVIRGKPDDYLDRRPDSSDVGLLIEMVGDLLKNDVGRKLVAYASSGIPAYWVLELGDLTVRVHESPVPAEGSYASIRSFGPGEWLELNLDGVPIGPIAASKLLPIR